MEYHITGVDTNGKRFKRTTNILWFALCINLWNGSVWEVTNNKRKLIKRVYDGL